MELSEAGDTQVSPVHSDLLLFLPLFAVSL